MPTAITGYAGGTLRQIVLQDDGTMTGDGLVVGWLTDNPPPTLDLGAVTLHVGKLLTEVHATPLPPFAPAAAPVAAAALAPAEPVKGAYTAAELDELTVADLREMATLARVPDAARMTKASLVAALLAQQGG